MKRILFLVFVFFLIQKSIAQKGKYVEVEMITHAVKMGETIRTISLKYLVEPGEIYQFNKYAVNGIKQGMTLLIPVPVKDPIATSEKKVKPKKVVDQTETNQEENTITTKSVTRPEVIDSFEVTEYTVEPKETLYSLSKKFNISADELKLSNPSIETSGVQIGMILKIPTKRTLGENESSIGSANTPVVEVKPKVSQPIVVSHTVVAKETLYSLSKKYEVPLDIIIKQNPILNVSGLKIGMVLTIKK
jgi:LysM repeat protein